MALLYDETNQTTISNYIQFETERDVTKIVSKALDGTTYIQIIGSGSTDYVGTVYVDRAEKEKLEDAYVGGNLLRIELDYGTYYGRITEKKMGKRQAANYFEAEVTLAKEVTI